MAADPNRGKDQRGHEGGQRQMHDDQRQSEPGRRQDSDQRKQHENPGHKRVDEDLDVDAEY